MGSSGRGVEMELGNRGKLPQRSIRGKIALATSRGNQDPNYSSSFVYRTCSGLWINSS